MFSFSDADALAFNNAVIANGGALSDTEKSAYQVYRIDSKTNANAWNGDAHLDYPMIGGTVESMVINAQNPGTFDAIAVNTVAGDFTVTGFSLNGVDSYFDSSFIPNVQTILNSIALEFYSRTDQNTTNFDWGADSGIGEEIFCRLSSINNGAFFDCYDSGGGRILGTTPATSAVSVMYSRENATNSDINVNGVSVIGINTSGGSNPTRPLYMGCRNNNGTADSFVQKECAGAGLYDGLSAVKVLAQYNARQTFNTTLSRQV